MSARQVVAEWLIEPGQGKAIEVRAGEVLRIEQVDGGQCVDFNAFNLHDYKEFMHCGRIRTVHGLNPGPGDFLWSAPPRERAMMYLLEDTVRCNAETSRRWHAPCLPGCTSWRARAAAPTTGSRPGRG